MRDALRKQTQPDRAKNASARPRPARVRFTTQPLATVTSRDSAEHQRHSCQHDRQLPRRPRTLANSSGSPAAYRGSAELTSRPKMQLISTSPSPHYAVAAESGSHDITARPCKANVSGKGRIVGLVIRFPRRYIRIQSRRGKANAGVGPPCGRLAERSAPSIWLTSCAAIASPVPVPPVSRLRESSVR